MERDWRCDVPEQRLIWAQATSEALRTIEGKWKIIIICQLFAAKAPLRFSELERRVEGVNQKMLIQQLKQLEADGILSRTLYPEVPPRVEYALTELGKALGPSMTALIDWALLRRATLGPEQSA
ncbi:MULTISPECIES: winged helix-turn-helix transcriptional regulator [Enterobacter]|uniref:winged helix-turn-helix transcriptional regulator n=1 Tax=Enterobacter TaxID=547 RepID=UPI00163AD6A2|nr:MULTISPECIES: helix-turn-helix domain-containing protein [Enterobacter]MBK1520874.1 helix-turn-helix transcriptional regulator [Enterobacter ludwigii]MDR6368588.1 DNA-binding HxlR family transcriptional regulator [Enterobacter sp. SORGH_AS_0287]